MTTSDGILIIIAVLLALRPLADLRRAWRRRGAPPAARYTPLESAVDAMTLVADGLHEDINALRRELRSAVSLPPETQIPRLIVTLRRTQQIAWASLALNISGGMALLWLLLARTP